VSRIAIQPKVSRDVYFKFKALAIANGVTVERAIEQAMRDILARARIPLTSSEEPVSTK
jgi:hypothetical protein